MKTKLILNILSLALACVVAAPGITSAQDKKPNIVVIWGDDIGTWNVGIYSHGMMGSTPNIDSIARNGALFQATSPLKPTTQQQIADESV